MSNVTFGFTSSRISPTLFSTAVYLIILCLRIYQMLLRFSMTGLAASCILQYYYQGLLERILSHSYDHHPRQSATLAFVMIRPKYPFHFFLR